MINLRDGRINLKARRAVIVATGRALPEKILDNSDLEKMVDTSDEWITTRCGINQRRIISEGQTTASLSLAAAQKALQTAQLMGEDLELIICATITPEMVFPATACFVQNSLNNHSCCAFDISAACSGFTYAMELASTAIAAGQYNNALVLGAETLSTITDYTDRTSCILFGDGAGAVILKAQDNSSRGMLYSRLHADGGGWDTLSCPAYGSRFPVGKPLNDAHQVYMQIRGRETYQLAVRRIVELIQEVYLKCNVTSDDIELIIPHQMNARIIESVVKRLDLPADKMFMNIDKYGNTSSASIPIALDEAVRLGRVKPGDLIIFVAFGGGLTWAVNLVRL